MQEIHRRIAAELGAREQQVTAAIDLLDDGATVPFVARYRKEATGGLDDAQLRRLEERLASHDEILLELIEDRAKHDVLVGPVVDNEDADLFVGLVHVKDVPLVLIDGANFAGD